MKKILFLAPIPPPFGGPEIENQMLLNTTYFKNNDLIHINSNIRSKLSQKGKLDAKGIYAFIKKYFEILRIFFTHNIDIFYFLLSSNKIGFLRDSIYVLTAWLLGKRIIAHYHGSYFDGFYVNQNKLYKKYIKFVLNKNDKIIIQAKSIKKIFKDLYPLKKLEVVFNGIDLKIYSLSDNREEKYEYFTILFLGSLWFPKGFYDLVLAYEQLFSKYENKIQFLFAGERSQYSVVQSEFLIDPWRRFYQQHGKQISSKINTFVNNCEKYNAKYLGLVFGKEKIKVFQKSDIFVLPSYTEGFSMACLEAMSMGLPVITTPVGALKEIVQDRVNGLITAIGDPTKLMHNIELFMLDDQLRHRISQNNLMYVRENFDIEIISKKLINILNN